MKGHELNELMKQGNVFVDFHGHTFEVVQKFRHVAWIKRNGVKKTVPFRFFTFKALVETENPDWSKINGSKHTKDDNKRKDLWEKR